MNKKLLWTIDFNEKKLEVKQLEYDVTENDYGLLITVTINGNGLYYMDKEFYSRTYGDTALDVISNRRKWLIEEVLPRKMGELTSTTDEIKEMTNWINDNA